MQVPKNERANKVCNREVGKTVRRGKERKGDGAEETKKSEQETSTGEGAQLHYDHENGRDA